MSGPAKSIDYETGAGRCVGVTTSMTLNRKDEFEVRTGEAPGSRAGAPDNGFYGARSRAYAPRVSASRPELCRCKATGETQSDKARTDSILHCPFSFARSPISRVMTPP